MLDLHAAPLWDADGNLLFRIFELGKGDTPLAIIDDDEFEKMVERLAGDLEIARKIDQQNGFPEIRREIHEEAPGTVFKMPNIKGLGKNQIGSIAYLHIKPGDKVVPDQTLFEVETDKACVAIPAKEAGTITQVLVKLGQSVCEGDRILKYLPPAND